MIGCLLAEGLVVEGARGRGRSREDLGTVCER